MKILITTDLYTVKTNGVVTSVRNLVTELTAMGQDVRILTFATTKQSLRQGQIYYIGSSSLERIYPKLRMPLRRHHPYVRELAAWKPDVIHSQCEFFSYTFARQIARASGAPIVHTYHALYEQYVPYVIASQRLGEYLVRVFTRRRLRSAAMIVAPTKKVEAALRGYGTANPISVVPSGIDLQQHSARLPSAERSRLRRELGIREEQQVLLNLGRLGSEKNIGELLDLFAMESAKRADLVLLIVGDGPARGELEQAARQLGISGRVIFTGMVAPQTVQNYYQLADIFVCASTSETQGLTYVEAAANGLPLLCRRDPCLEGILIPGENGFAYTCAGDFSDGLRRLLDDPAFCRQAGTKSMQLARSFGCDTFAKRILEVYSQAMSKTHIY